MNKYHKELEELSEKLHEYPSGYGCGKCWECDDMYKTFMKIVKRIKEKQKRASEVRKG